MFKRIFIFIFSALMIMILNGCGSNDLNDNTKKNSSSVSNTNYKIYLITMDKGSNYWQLVDSGCRQAAKEIEGINYKWSAPTNHKIEEQARCIDEAVAEGVNAIIISAISLTDVNENLKKAYESGVKIIYVDSAASYENFVAMLLTDNEAAGKIAAETMQKALSEREIKSGTIGIAVSSANTQNATMRDKGFRDQFAGTNFNIAPTIYLDDDRQKVKNYVKDHPEYVSFFGGNEQSTRVIAEEIKYLGSKQIIIGFDTSDFVMQMINENLIYATIQQKPVKMGHDAIEIAVKSLNGTYSNTGIIIDIGVDVVTKD